MRAAPIWLTLASLVASAALAEPIPSSAAGGPETAPVDSERGDGLILFGDLHAHTTYSYDAFLFSLPLLGGEGSHPPDDACDFARHCASLDFFALTDHAESLLPEDWVTSKESVRACNRRAGSPDNPDIVAFMGFEWSQAGKTPDQHFGHRCVVFRNDDDASLPDRPIASADTRANMEGLQGMVSMARWAAPWNMSRHNAFLDYVDDQMGVDVCPEGIDTRRLPDDCREVAPTPRELHEKLDQWGLDALSIPHGMAWGVYTPATTTIEKHLAKANYDPKWMKLLEVMSGHGNSEEFRPLHHVNVDAAGNRTCPKPTPDFLPCCWQAGEIMRKRCGDLAPDECERRVQVARDYAAQTWVRTNLVFPDAGPEDWLDCGQCRNCFKPSFNYRPKESAQYAMALSRFDPGAAEPVRFRYGFIGSSDGHTGRPGHGYKQIEPDMMSDTRPPAAFPYNLFATAIAGGSMEDPTMPELPSPTGAGVRGNDLRVASFLYPGGLAAVHAPDRSRKAIWDALQNRRVYGTSGPRILLWFDLRNGPDGPAPMGTAVELTETPRFEVRAVGSFEQKPGCPESSRAGLSADRLEYLCRGECHHPSDHRRSIRRIEVIRIRPQRVAGEEIAPLIEDPWKTFSCEPSQEGCLIHFEDPDFVSDGRDTLYYVRAIEEATPALNANPLETVFDEQGRARAIRPCLQDRVAEGGCPAPSEERAWSSPIYVDVPRAG